MAVNFKLNIGSGVNIDLTDPDVNPQAAPTSTPRQGGFTLRNRVNFANVSAANKQAFKINATPSSASQDANVLRVLEVPERTLITDFDVFAIKSATIPGFGPQGSQPATPGGSMLASAIIGFDAELNVKPTSSASYAAASHLLPLFVTQNGGGKGATLGQIAIQNYTASWAFEANQVVAVDSMMSTAANAIRGRVLTERAVTGSGVVGASAKLYFPLGGYVYMALGPDSTALGSAGSSTAASTIGEFTGTWDFQAQCQYVPE
jgi:hypothetical protein